MYHILSDMVSDASKIPGALRARIDTVTEETVLSMREAEALVLEQEGYDRRETGRLLKISPASVDTYRRRAAEKITKAENTVKEFGVSTEGRTSGSERLVLRPSPGTDDERDLYLVPCASESRRRRHDEFFDKGIDTTSYGGYLPTQVVQRRKSLSVWFIQPDVSNKGPQLVRGDVFAFYLGTYQYRSVGVVLDAEPNRDLAQALVSNTPTLNYSLGEGTYAVYFDSPISMNIDSRRLHEELGYEGEFPRRVQRVATHRIDSVRAQYGDFETLLGQIQNSALIDAAEL